MCVLVVLLFVRCMYGVDGSGEMGSLVCLVS